MATASATQRDQDLKSLETRLRGLEQSVCDTLNEEDFNKETKHVTNLSTRLSILVKKYNELENEHDDIKHLIEKYNEFEAFLEKDIKDPPNLHSSEKKAILLSAFNDFKKISQQLAEVENLRKPAIETNPIKDLQSLENNVSNVELNTQKLLLETVDFKKELESFLTNYNDLVYLTSQKFLQWDAILTDMEKRYMNRNRQQHESEPKTFTETDSSYAAQ